MSFIKSLEFGKVKTKNNLILAPLAGYSHKPMRILNRKYGAGYTVTEMVSIEGIIQDSQKTFRYADISDNPQLTSIQLFGKYSPKQFYTASKIIQKMYNVNSININFGCPAAKILKNGAGSKLLNEPQKMVDIINAVKDSGVSVEAKIRAGFNKDNLSEVITHLDNSDVDIIMLHCRLTRDKFIHNTAKWDYFGQARKLTNKLLIANGDIKTPEDALFIFQNYNVDGLMIGRSAITKPYLFQQILDYCKFRSYTQPSPDDLLGLLEEYAKLWFEITKYESIIPLRSAIMSLLIGFNGAAKLRATLSQSTSLDDIYKAISNYKSY